MLVDRIPDGQGHEESTREDHGVRRGRAGGHPDLSEFRASIGRRLPKTTPACSPSAMVLHEDEPSDALTRRCALIGKRATASAVGREVYLDCNASAPLDPRVAEVMASTLTNAGNAASVHAFGRRQSVLVDDARERVAELVGSPPSNVVFTASATEANNLALQGVALADSTNRSRILVSAVEHASVLKTAEWLQARGISQVDVIPVTHGGFVDLHALERLIGLDVLLVSVMAANGETGVLNPIAEVAELAHANGSLFHCDAT